MQTQEKSFPLLLQNNFPEEKKSKTLLFRALIKGEILTSHEVLYMKLVCVISSCFAIKMLSKNTGFSRLKCQLKWKKIDTACFWRFSKFQLTREWVNEVNVLSFQFKNFFKCMLAWFAREKQNMFTYSHANTSLGQSECVLS